MTQRSKGRRLKSIAWLIIVLPLIVVSLAVVNVTAMPAELGTSDTSKSSTTPPIAPQVYHGFARNVTAVLDKAGCNLGACHGNQRGKGGFLLSLRGEAPLDDYKNLVVEEAGRRLDLISPQQSLTLLKATAQIAHAGGRRLHENSTAYQNLLAWLSSGAPAPTANDPYPQSLRISPEELVVPADQASVQLKIEAVWPDNSVTDITDMAVYEAIDPTVSISANGKVVPSQKGHVQVLVRYLGLQQSLSFYFASKPIATHSPSPSESSPDELSLNQSWIDESWIDEPIARRLTAVGLQRAQQADDATLVRRIYIDLLGRIPKPEEAKEYVLSNAHDKWDRLVDQLLASAEFPVYWSLKWGDVLRCDEKVLDGQGVEIFSNWIRNSIADGLPINVFVKHLLTAEGSTYQNPPANFYRALRDPQSRGEAVARVFLGYRMQCAQCHNHPFDRWTQADYYSWSSVFSGLEYEIKSNERKDDLDKNEFRGEQIILVKDIKPLKHPRTSQKQSPKVLESQSIAISNQDPRHEMADWLTSPQNLQFARTQVNWIFFHLMGRGLVDPVDDFRATNPASHPDLLDEMAHRWIAHDYDLRWMIREIVLSYAYKQSHQAENTAPTDPSFFAYRIVRRHQAEVLADAQSDVLAVPLAFDQQPPGIRAIALRAGQREQRYLKSAGDAFLGAFGKPQRLSACECERSNDLSLSQVLILMQGDSVEKRIGDSKGRAKSLSKSDKTPTEIIEELYWIALSRAPNATELQQATDSLSDPEKRAQGVEDLVWALINSQEFLLHH